MSHPSELSTVDEIIDALGGVAAVQAVTGQKYNTVWNWKWRGKVPPEFHLIVSQALAGKGLSAPARLFGQREVAS